eukprot:GHVT01070633.1.p1 GENE.GHVT01070633.1~~GHVT01070633.1.p1  ORF type:complete len:199 (+),score=32.77 GHVT01070633.1:392-988(+)
MPVPEVDVDSQEGIVIAQLRKNQSLNVKLIATKGTGKVHAKWIPVATAVYRFEPIVLLNSAMMAEVPAAVKREIALSDPCNLLIFGDDTAQGGNGTLTVNEENKAIYNFNDDAIAKAAELGYRGLISIDQDESIAHFTVESTGCLPPERIVELAFQILTEKLKDVERNVEKTKEKATGEYKPNQNSRNLGGAGKNRRS